MAPESSGLLFGAKWDWVAQNKQRGLCFWGNHSTAQDLIYLPTQTPLLCFGGCAYYLHDGAEGDQRGQMRLNAAERGWPSGLLPKLLSLHTAGHHPRLFRVGWTLVVTSHKCPQMPRGFLTVHELGPHVLTTACCLCFCPCYYNNRINGHCK